DRRPPRIGALSLRYRSFGAAPATCDRRTPRLRPVDGCRPVVACTTRTRTATGEVTGPPSATHAREVRWAPAGSPDERAIGHSAARWSIWNARRSAGRRRGFRWNVRVPLPGEPGPWGLSVPKRPRN